jgi:hypothetical protein
MSQDQDFNQGLQIGFEVFESLVYWMDGGRTIRVRPSRGQAITRAWQTPRDRELIRSHILWLNAEGFIDHDEAFSLWNAVCNMVADRIEVVEELEELEPDDSEFIEVMAYVALMVLVLGLSFVGFMWGA